MKVEGIPVRRGKKRIAQPVQGLARVSQDVLEFTGMYCLTNAELRAARRGDWYIVKKSNSEATQPVTSYTSGVPVNRDKLVALAQVVNSAKPWRK